MGEKQPNPIYQSPWGTQGAVGRETLIVGEVTATWEWEYQSFDGKLCGIV